MTRYKPINCVSFSLQKIMLAAIIFLQSVQVYAQTIDELISQNKLSVVASVDSEYGVIVRQPVTINIEVATARWFSKGVLVQPFSIGDVVIPNVSGLAINGSKKVQGQTWVTQVREIIVYPMKAGEYRIPEMSVSVSVKTEHGVVEGVVITEPLFFTASLPPSLKGISEFVASPEVTLSIEGGTEGEYRVGDAVTVSIELTAEATLAMLLPEIEKINFAGVSIYRKPSRLLDESSRGSLLARRTETNIYMFEKDGEYLLPKRIVYWWDSDEDILKELVIPELQWHVNKPRFSWTKIFGLNVSLISIAVLLVLCLSAIAGVYLLLKYFNKLTKRRTKGTFTKRREKRLYLHAIMHQDYILACQHLYNFHNLPRNGIVPLRDKFSSDERRLDILNRLYISAFYLLSESSIMVKSISYPDAKLLLTIIPLVEFSNKLTDPAIEIELNT